MVQTLSMVWVSHRHGLVIGRNGTDAISGMG